MNKDENINELKAKLADVTKELKNIVDYSITIRTDREMKKTVAIIWQQFLGDFFSYIRKRSKETGENLLTGITFAKFWR